MFKRTWFFQIESVPSLIESRRNEGKITRVSGFVSKRSFFVNYDSIKDDLLNRVVMRKDDFNNGEYMLVSMSRV
jgi:hypothetical protein